MPFIDSKRVVEMINQQDYLKKIEYLKNNLKSKKNNMIGIVQRRVEKIQNFSDNA